MGEKTILQLINHVLTELGLNYYYMTNSSETVIYPYVTGEYFENDYKYESGGTTGEILLKVWTRGSETELIEIKDKIKNKFKNYQTAILENSVMMSLAINYLSKMPLRTDTEGLKKLEIRLEIHYWKDTGK